MPTAGGSPLIVNEFGDVGFDGELLEDCAAKRVPRGRHRSSWPMAASAARSPTISSPPWRSSSAATAPPDAHRHRDLRAGAAAAAGQGVRAGPRSDQGRPSTAWSPWSTRSALAEGRFASTRLRWPRSAPPIPALEHDDPIEELFEDQLALRRPGRAHQDRPGRQPSARHDRARISRATAPAGSARDRALATAQLSRRC